MSRGGSYGLGLALAALVTSTGCKASIGDAPRTTGDDAGGTGVDGSPSGDASDGVDALSIDAALGMFSTPAPIPNTTATKGQDDPVLSSDGLELIFAIDNTATNTNKDLYRATRTATTDPFGAPVPLSQLNTATAEESPRLSADDLTLYYASNEDIMMSTRATTSDPFGTPTPVTYVNTAAYEKWFDVCSSGYYLVSRANGATGQDFFEGHLGSATTGAVAELNSPDSEISTFLQDCLTVYFASNRPVAGVTPNPTRIYMSTRASEANPWTTPALVTTFGVSADDEDLYITPNGRIAVLASTRATAVKEMFLSTR